MRTISLFCLFVLASYVFAKPEADLTGQADFEKFRDRLPWIWQSPRQFEPPKVKDPAWPTDAVDRFVLRKLEAEKLKPAGPANDRVWMRRVYFAITGLPPKAEDIQTFLDASTLRRADQSYVQSNGSMKQLIISLLTSDSFLYRKR